MDGWIDQSLRCVSAFCHTHNERERDEKLERPWPLWPLRFLWPCFDNAVRFVDLDLLTMQTMPGLAY